MAVGVAQGQIKDVREDLRQFQPTQQQLEQLKLQNGQGGEGGDGSDSTDNSNNAFLDNYFRFVQRYKQEKAKKRDTGLGSILRRGKMGKQSPNNNNNNNNSIINAGAAPGLQGGAVRACACERVVSVDGCLCDVVVVFIDCAPVSYTHLTLPTIYSV